MDYCNDSHLETVYCGDYMFIIKHRWTTVMTMHLETVYCGDYMFIIKHRWTTVMTLHLETVLLW